MGYTLVYTQVLEFFPYLIRGAVISLQIAVLAFFGGLFFGLIFATIRTFGNKIIEQTCYMVCNIFYKHTSVSSGIFLIFCFTRIWNFIITFYGCINRYDIKCCSIPM